MNLNSCNPEQFLECVLLFVNQHPNICDQRNLVYKWEKSELADVSRCKAIKDEAKKIPTYIFFNKKVTNCCSNLWLVFLEICQ